MNIISDIKSIKEQLNIIREAGKSIGFVPTMGALHNGHISLIKKAKVENDIVVCSIFVNPTQFNNVSDLEKYPKTFEADVAMLHNTGCNLLFFPSVNEMYEPNSKNKHYELGYLETILEGKYRSGHFQGVCIIVDKLLNIILPTTLYLGRKDYQQCMVVKKMMDDKKHLTKLIICDTVRETNGLAMSSRNMRLNNLEKELALKIFESLMLVKKGIEKGSVKNILQKAYNFLELNNFKVDYVTIADAESLQIIDVWDGQKKVVALAAAYLGDVRLIDNIDL